MTKNARIQAPISQSADQHRYSDQSQKNEVLSQMALRFKQNKIKEFLFTNSTVSLKFPYTPKNEVVTTYKKSTGKDSVIHNFVDEIIVLTLRL